MDDLTALTAAMLSGHTISSDDQLRVAIDFAVRAKQMIALLGDNPTALENETLRAEIKQTREALRLSQEETANYKRQYERLQSIFETNRTAVSNG